MSHPKALVALVCLLLTLVAATPVVAQGGGVLRGRVLIADGAPAAGATVSIDALGLATTTAADGSFAFPSVPTGTWEVIATMLVGTASASVKVTGATTPPVTLTLAPTLPGVAARISVTARADGMLRIADSASEGVVGRIDLETRPLLRVGELVETVPGVIATQHSGGGKANQYFLRGFNLDHGTDFAARVDGVPINMPSHGHGQGYLDLNFLIPEMVDAVRFRKGLVDVRDSDFSAAGAVDFDLRDRLDRSLISFAGGEYGYARALALGSVAVGGGDLIGGLELLHTDGPWTVPGNFRKLNAIARFTRADATGGVRFTALGYDASWDATDQIPLRAVDDSTLNRFDSLDDTTGGTSSRYGLTAEWSHTTSASMTSATAYLTAYDLDLYSNFTYLLEDPRQGDQFRQVDDRWLAGTDVLHERSSRLGDFDLIQRFGLQLRQDWIDNGLFRTAARQRLSTVREDSISALSIGPYADATVYWSPWLRTTAGVRADWYGVDVASDDPRNSGTGNDLLASPKLSIAFGPWASTELYGNFGGGFHSNDARGVTISIDPATGEPVPRVPLLVRGWGWETGVRTQAFPGLNSSIAVFGLDLDSELVYVGDAGGTEAGRPSRRRGIELANFYTPRPWLRFDVDIAFTRARFDDADPADRIPGALERVVAAGVAVDGYKQWSGSLRMRAFGNYPLTEDNTVRSEGSTLVNGRLAYLLPIGFEVGFEVFNLLDENVNDIEYYYASRLAGEPIGGIEDVHFHPAEPRTFRVLASWRR